MVVGCYRPPSAVKDSLSSLATLLLQLDYKEIVLLGDFNWHWLNAVSEDLKNLCISLNVTQIVDSPTRPNIKSPNKSSLIGEYFR